ncbi:MAG: potassium transporter TrkA [Spirochaetes bacterium GWD1_27_9]|nr:MAG: potassium transporter TrkA [Spirochaetes bacterium GWB1_27_13]OHD20119.1 MAG: potassium transporter TrkA [Spirochaetes bacterium GWC1_27_15]OHD28844.1 MAG: potassium transporter TrkA [Spirochaetes bacterium GWD1_27_9]
MAKEKTIAIFGLGAFGFEICKRLAEKGGKVIAIDKDPKLIEKIKDSIMQAILIDSTDEESLKKSALENVDVAVVAMGENLQASIITTALLKKINIPYIIARATSDIHSQLLKQIGANEVINLEIEEGKRIANRLISPNVLERIPISKSQIFAEIIVPKSFVGKTLQQIDLRNKANINVISIRRIILKIDEMGNPLKEENVLIPKPSDVLELNDILAIVGTDKEIESLKGF